jgi:hypothetical protein
LLDRATQKEFAQAPVVAAAVARVASDAGRFVLRCVNKATGQVALVGLAFSASGDADADAQHAFHFANALKDFANFNKKSRERAAAAALAAWARDDGGLQLAAALEVSGRAATSLSGAEAARLPGLRALCEATLMDPEASSVSARQAHPVALFALM